MRSLRETVTPVRVLLVLTLSASVLPYTDIFPTTYSYVVVASSYAVLASVAVITQFPRRVPPTVLALFTVIWMIYLGHLFTDPSAGSLQNLLRPPVFVVFSFLGVFVLPQLVEERVLLWTVAGLSGILAVAGLPSAVLGSYTIGPVAVPIRTSGMTFPNGDPLFTVQSIMSNPNPFGFLTAVGSLAALGIAVRNRSILAGCLTVVSGLGLVGSQSRAAIGGFAIGLLVFTVVTLSSRRASQFILGVLFTLGGAVGSFAVWQMWTTGAVPIFGLESRVALWQATVETSLQAPIFGHGPGNTGEMIHEFVESRYISRTPTPHNSYLRMFLTTGFVGGVSYLLVTVAGTLTQCRNVVDTADATRLGLLLLVVTTQLFESYSLFGVSFNSVFASMLFGYVFYETMETEDAVSAVSTLGKRIGITLDGSE